MDDSRLHMHREFLKDSLRKQINFSTTDQSRGVPPPPLQKPFDTDALRVRLCLPEQWRPCIAHPDLPDVMARRKSRRSFSDDHLTLQELSFLLWATQGVRRVAHEGTAFRTVPSAGARHSFETYLFVCAVEGVSKGLYRFLPLNNELLVLGEVPHMEAALIRAAFGQKFVGAAAVTFVWACVPYRMEWRYGLAAHRVILMDVGHACQNLYLACEAVGAGTCAVAAYDQEELDRLVGLDGRDEFCIYMAPVGRAHTHDN